MTSTTLDPCSHHRDRRSRFDYSRCFASRPAEHYATGLKHPCDRQLRRDRKRCADQITAEALRLQVMTSAAHRNRPARRNLVFATSSHLFAKSSLSLSCHPFVVVQLLRLRRPLGLSNLIAEVFHCLTKQSLPCRLCRAARSP